MEDSLRPAKKKRKKRRTVISLDQERSKRAADPVPVPEPDSAVVINFRKAVKRLRSAKRRRKTSTSMPVDETLLMVLRMGEHVRQLSDHQKALARRNRIVMDEFNQNAELLGQVVRSMSAMNHRLMTLEDEMVAISSKLTTALREKKRLKAQLDRARNRK